MHESETRRYRCSLVVIPTSTARSLARGRCVGKRVWARIDMPMEEVIDDLLVEGLRRDPDRIQDVGCTGGWQRRASATSARRAFELGIELTVVVVVIHVLEYLWDATTAFNQDGTAPDGRCESSRAPSLWQPTPTHSPHTQGPEIPRPPTDDEPARRATLRERPSSTGDRSRTRRRRDPPAINTGTPHRASAHRAARARASSSRCHAARSGTTRSRTPAASSRKFSLMISK